MKLFSTESHSIEQRPSKLPTSLLAIAAEIGKKVLSVLRSARVQRRVRAMQILERVALGNKQSILLLRVDNQELVVGCCGDSMVLLGSRKSGSEKIKRRKAEPITAQITNHAELLSEVMPEKAQSFKSAVRRVQSSTSAHSLPGPQPVTVSAADAAPGGASRADSR